MTRLDDCLKSVKGLTPDEIEEFRGAARGLDTKGIMSVATGYVNEFMAESDTISKLLVDYDKKQAPKSKVFDQTKPVADHLGGKYKNLYNAPESELPHTHYQKIMDGKMTPAALGKLAAKAKDKKVFTKNAEGAIADLLGDVEETYKYEGQEEGKAKEKYVDSLLKALEGTKVPDTGTKPKADKNKGEVPADRGVKPVPAAPTSTEVVRSTKVDDITVEAVKKGKDPVEPKVDKPKMSKAEGTVLSPGKKHRRPIITQAQKKAAAKKRLVKKKQIEIETAEDAREIAMAGIRQRRIAINLAMYDTNEFIHNINQVTTRAQRETIPFIIEGKGVPKELNRPDIEKAYVEDRKLLDPIAKQVQKHFHESWKKFKANVKNMSAGEIENYVTHIWDVPHGKKQEVSNWFTTQDRFRKKRFIATLSDGITELGLKPKVLDIGEIIRIHDSVSIKAVENQKFVDGLLKLRKNGVPLIERHDKAPMTWAFIDHPALRKSLFIPGETKMGEKISRELEDILHDMGVAIGRRIRPGKTLGMYKPGDPPEVRFQRFMSNRTIAHEIGHHIDKVMGLGEAFLNQHKTELYALNKKRIEDSGLEKSYTTSASEQIAEAFAHLFAMPKVMAKVAPTAMADMVNRLRKDGVLTQLTTFDFENKAKNLLEEQINILAKVPVRVHPDLLKPMNVVFQSTDIGRIGAAYDAIAGVLKKTSLSLSLFHPGALIETGIATMNPIKVGNIAFNPVKIFNAVARGELDVYKNVPLARDAIGAGVQVGSTSDIPVQKIQGYLNSLANKGKGVPGVEQATELLRTFNEKWDVALWEYLHDTLKIYAYESLLAKNLDLNGDITKQKQDIAQLVNDTFGGQNMDILMISPKMQLMMTRMLLSPDWTISTARQALSAFGFGAIHKSNKALRKKMGRRFWLKAALYFGIGINALNAAARMWDREKNPEYYEDVSNNIIDKTMYGNAYGHRTHLFAGRYDDGTERYLRWGKQFREFLEMVYDYSGLSPVTAALKKVGGKANPMLQILSQAFTGHTLSGFKNKDIYGKEGWDKTLGISKMLLKAPLPFSSRTILDPNSEFHITDLAMPSSKGMTKPKAMHLFKAAVINGDMQMLKEIYEDVYQNNLPPMLIFKDALTSLKAEETIERNKLEKDIKNVKLETQDDVARFKRRLKKMQKELKDKELGMALLDQAILDAEVFMEKRKDK